jgi:hypothetical protein
MPLRRAVHCRQCQIVRLLVQYGADPHVADRRGATPPSGARNAEMKQALADAGASCHPRNWRLHAQGRAGATEVVACL